ncbi:MAG: hypothetical protein ABEH78_06805 [Haloferacaceae archaeon]
MITTPDKVDCQDVEEAIRQLKAEGNRVVSAGEVADKIAEPVTARAVGFALTYDRWCGYFENELYAIDRDDDGSNDYWLL